MNRRDVSAFQVRKGFPSFVAPERFLQPLTQPHFQLTRCLFRESDRHDLAEPGAPALHCGDDARHQRRGLARARRRLDEKRRVEIGGRGFALLVINGLHLTLSLIARKASMCASFCFKSWSFWMPLP